MPSEGSSVTYSMNDFDHNSRTVFADLRYLCAVQDLSPINIPPLTLSHSSTADQNCKEIVNNVVNKSVFSNGPFGFVRLILELWFC